MINPIGIDSPMFIQFMEIQGGYLHEGSRNTGLVPCDELSPRENLLCWECMISNAFSGTIVPNVIMLFDRMDRLRISLLLLMDLTEFFDSYLLEIAQKHVDGTELILTLFGEKFSLVNTLFHDCAMMQYPDPEPGDFKCFREKYEISVGVSLLGGFSEQLAAPSPDDDSDRHDEDIEEEFDTSYSLSFWKNRWWNRRSEYQGGYYYHCHNHLCEASVYVRDKHASVIKEHTPCCPELEDLQAPQAQWNPFIRELTRRARQTPELPASRLLWLMTEESEEWREIILRMSFGQLLKHIHNERPPQGQLGQSVFSRLPQSSQDFVRYYSPGDDSMILLGSEYLMERAARVDWILVDATFKVCPVPYYQFLSIMGEDIDTGQFIPICGMLMKDKKPATYALALDIISIYVQFPNVRHVTCDFEPALKNELTLWISRLELDVSFLGCKFHFTQCIRKRFMKIWGRNLQIPIYILMKVFRKAMYLDLRTIQDMLKALVNRDEKLDQFVRYFERTWIPIFYEWNLTSFPDDKKDRATNNGLESYHSRLLSKLDEHPRIERFIYGVKAIADDRERSVKANIQRQMTVSDDPEPADIINDFNTVLRYLPDKRSPSTSDNYTESE